MKLGLIAVDSKAEHLGMGVIRCFILFFYLSTIFLKTSPRPIGSQRYSYNPNKSAVRVRSYWDEMDDMRLKMLEQHGQQPRLDGFLNFLSFACGFFNPLWYYNYR
ncbi:hypothetical protein RF11_03879 [Thelohanellus kitauei]|uniref:Uncharacterized protein n=1 Tax=Thelohanellus kitauei TaxID=669202 RepID=A0A0C2MRW3_THEKT|nr:hypothetical protein RF11_03879 [Thelohanellus kitauei]